MKRIYLDYAASTPVDPRVLRAMQPYFTERFGNPGSLHAFGQEAIAAVDRSREAIAKSIGAEFREVIFTSSATEANNLALRGAFQKFKNEKSRESRVARPCIIMSVIEHESILETARELEREGAEIIFLPVNKQGMVNATDIKKYLNDDTAIVSVMYANNEIGVIQPIAEIAKIIREFRKNKTYPLFHADAAQAFQFLDCKVQNLGVDLMTLSSHKIYGPKGCGALYIKKGPKEKVPQAVAPILFGGGQEFDLRSGTENVPAIVGFAKAVSFVLENQSKENKKIEALKKYFWQEIKKIFPKAELNGGGAGGTVSAGRLAQSSLPNILNIYFPGHATQDLLTRFDLAGLAASSGSACRSRAFESSYVIKELGFSTERAKSTIRFSFGRPTTLTEIKQAVKLIDKFKN